MPWASSEPGEAPLPDANGNVTLGVTIDIPEPYGTLLREARAALGDPHADEIPSHVTLIPPMEIPADAWPLVRAHIFDVADNYSPFIVQLRGTGTFHPVSRVVFVALARGITHCQLLSEQLRKGVLRQRLDYPYHPHVTIAQDVPDEVLEEAFEKLSDFELSFMVHGFGVYLHGESSEWELQDRVPFGP